VNAVVLDHTALVSLGEGNRLTSQLVDGAHQDSDRHVFIPAMCLAAAVAQRVAIGDHIGLMPALEVVELDYPDACLAGRLVADGVDWGAAHAVAVGRPTVDFPDGRPVVTAVPDEYKDRGVATIAIGG
jgi:hypothetical protein